jgi:hypothetical protein
MDMGVNFEENEGEANEEKPIIWQGENAILREEKKWLLVIDFPNSEKAPAIKRDTEFKPKQQIHENERPMRVIKKNAVGQRLPPS